MINEKSFDRGNERENGNISNLSDKNLKFLQLLTTFTNFNLE